MSVILLENLLRLAQAGAHIVPPLPAFYLKPDEATGVVRVIKEKCTGCKICILACPFGNIAFSSEEKTAAKCELCGDEPECIIFCPTRALEFREADTAMIYKQRTLSEKLKGIYEGIK